MRYGALLLMLLLAGCSNDSMTRKFTLSRDSGPQNVAATRVPLNVPPDLAMRPARSHALVPNPTGNAQATDQTTGSAGQDALLQDSGPPASSDIRTVINENSGLVYPGQGFTDRLMTWTPPPGYTPVITQGSKGGWLSRLF